ncbi:MAG: hypothetical protein VB143_01855 [Burkholderia sp.]
MLLGTALVAAVARYRSVRGAGGRLWRDRGDRRDRRALDPGPRGTQSALIRADSP